AARRPARADRLPVLLRDRPLARVQDGRRAGRVGRPGQLRRVALGPAVLPYLPLHGRRHPRQARARHVDGAPPEREVQRPLVHARPALPPLGHAQPDRRALLALDLRRHAQRDDQPHPDRLVPRQNARPVPGQPRLRALVRHRRDHLAGHALLDHDAAGRHAGDPRPALRGRRDRRRQRHAALPLRHRAAARLRPRRHLPALDDLDRQLDQLHLHPDARRPGRRDHDVPDARLRRRRHRRAPDGDGRRHLGALLPHLHRRDLLPHQAHALLGGALVTTSASVRLVRRLVLVVGLGFFTLWTLFPIYWIVSTSLKPNAEIYGDAALWPRSLTFIHFDEIFNQTRFGTYFRNSLEVSVLTTVCAMAIGVLAAYALTRLTFTGRTFVARSVIVTYLVPGSLLFIPVFQLAYTLGLTDKALGLVVVYLIGTVPFCTWLAISYFN